MASAIDRQSDEQAIHALIDRWATAARKGDLDTVMTCYTPDIVAFDALMAFQCRGVDEYYEHWKKCVAMLQPGQTMILEVHHPAVEVGGDAAFVHYLSRCGGCNEKGEEQVGWMRATVCCRRTDEGWRIAHEHYSAPFDPESLKAVFDFEPR